MDGRCCSPGTISVSLLIWKVWQLKICVQGNNPLDPAIALLSLDTKSRTCYEWERTPSRTFEFEYCSCDITKAGLERFRCPTGTIKISKIQTNKCGTSVVASAMKKKSAGLTRCPGSFDEITFDSVELGTLWLDFVVLADSKWIKFCDLLRYSALHF